MYNLEINFLQHRSSSKLKVEYGNEVNSINHPINQRNFIPIFVGLGLGLCFPALAWSSLWWLQDQNSGLEGEVAQLNNHSQNLDQQLTQMQKIREQTTTIEQQTENLVTVFEQMRSWSVILQELGNRIPSKVQIESLEHKQITTLSTKTEQLEITGYALNFKAVNQFLLNIGKSKLFNAKNSRINMAELVDAPPVTGAIVTQQSSMEFKPLQVVKYNMTISLTDVPVSNLVRELEKKGAMGLVEKIRHLERIGAISK